MGVVISLGGLLRWLPGRDLLMVFTNGCFDVIHAGHVRALERARNEGDFLVVGINSDTSVRRIKGPGRPIIPQEHRAEVVAALKSVDYVTIFYEDTPQELIEQLKPDVLVKGEEWRNREIAGREFIESRGGRTVFIPLFPGLSTTDVVQKCVILSKITEVEDKEK